MSNKRKPIAYCPKCVKKRGEFSRLVEWDGVELGKEYICGHCWLFYSWDQACDVAKKTGNKYRYGEKRPRKDKSVFVMSDGSKVHGKFNANKYAATTRTKILRELQPL